MSESERPPTCECGHGWDAHYVGCMYEPLDHGDCPFPSLAVSERPPVDPLREAWDAASDLIRLMNPPSSVTNAPDDPYGKALIRWTNARAALVSPAAQCPACGGSGHEWWPIGDDSYGCVSPAAPRPEGLPVGFVPVRLYSGGVLADGTTNTEPIDFLNPPPLSDTEDTES